MQTIVRDPLTKELHRIKRRFDDNLREVVEVARRSNSVGAFEMNLRNYLVTIRERSDSPETLRAIERVNILIDFNEKSIHELSTDEYIKLDTITCLYNFLSRRNWEGITSDMMLDLYKILMMLNRDKLPVPSLMAVKRSMGRWPTGLSAGVVAIREANKSRIIDILVKKIEKRSSVTSSQYFFPEGLSPDEKREMVAMWWNNSRFHLSMAIKSPTELNLFMNNSLSKETMAKLMRAKSKGMPFFVTPYYISLLNSSEEGYDDYAIRSYIFYSDELVETYGSIKAWEREDIVEEGKPNAAGWMLPDGNNIHRRYPEVAILIPDSMGRACGGLCASCQRMYDFQSERLNFEFENLKPKESWEKKLRRLMTYFEEDTQLKDILITGGDALMSQNATLRRILDAVYKMALRKREANMLRADGEKYAEIKRVRLGSRLLAYLPMRVDEELIRILKEFRFKAKKAGIEQFYIQTHFQSPLEVTPEAKKAIEAILSTGWRITNQLVFNVAASRRGHTAKLRRVLNSVGVVCYYTFSVKGFRENYAVFAPNSRSVQEQREEKIYGYIPEDKRDELYDILSSEKNPAKALSAFLKENHLLFAGTDRNVLNLPAIGKSMTFTTVGVTKTGQRVLRFGHDRSREHSPIIEGMGDVFIVENKSVAAYLRQLRDIGEDINEYTSIWSYTEGVTEPCFSLYEYPEYGFEVTNRVSNIGIVDN